MLSEPVLESSTWKLFSNTTGATNCLTLWDYMDTVVVSTFALLKGTELILMLRESCLTLEIDEFRCYEAKIEEGEKASSCQESNPGHLWLEPPVLCYWATTTGQPPALTILYMYCTGGTECLRHIPGSLSVCVVRTLLGVDQKILSRTHAEWFTHFRVEVSLVRLLVTARFLTSLYFHLITSKLIYELLLYWSSTFSCCIDVFAWIHLVFVHRELHSPALSIQYSRFFSWGANFCYFCD